MSLFPADLKQVVVFQNATDDELQSILKNGIARSIEACLPIV